MRRFSTSTARKLDLSGLYNQIKRWREPKKKPTVSDPTKTKSETAEIIENSMPTKLRIIGQPKRIEDEWHLVDGVAQFEAWPTNFHSKTTTVNLIETRLEQVQDADIKDLSKRLETLKKVCLDLKTAIPDPYLAQITDVSSLKACLLKSVEEFDELRPDAVYFKPEDFEGTSVVFEDTVKLRKTRKARMEALYKEALANREKPAEQPITASN